MIRNSVMSVYLSIPPVESKLLARLRDAHADAMPFSLLVRRSPEGDSVEVTVNADDTVEALARLAAASFSKEEGGAAVCFCGQVLRPEVTLASAGVTAAHFLVLCFPNKQRGIDGAIGAAELRGRPQAQPPPTAPAPPRSAPSLRRVCSGKGWVVHGLLLEYSDGVRTGFFGENDGSPLPLSDDAALLRRGGVWQDVSPGEHLVSISGHNSTMGYLCAPRTATLGVGGCNSRRGRLQPHVPEARLQPPYGMPPPQVRRRHPAPLVGPRHRVQGRERERLRRTLHAPRGGLARRLTTS